MSQPPRNNGPQRRREPEPGTEGTPGDSLTPASHELTGTVMRGAGFAVGGYVFAQVLTLGFYLALARLATPEDFGEFAAASIVVNVGLLFTESGMLAAVIYRRERVEEAASTAVVATAAAGLLFALLALALSPLIGKFFGSTKIGELAAALSGLLFLRSLQVVPEALLQRRFSFLRRVVVEPAQVTAFGIAAVIATANDLGAWGLVIGFYASAATDVLLSWPLARWWPKMRLVSFAMWRELIGYGRHIVASNAAHRLGDQVPKLLIGRFIGEASLGQFRYGERIAVTPLALIVSAASYVLFPAFARISDDAARFRAAFLRSLRWFAIVAFPLALVLVPLGMPLSVTLFGEVWRDAGYAAMALSGLTIGASLISLESEAFKAGGTPRTLVGVHVVAAVAGTAAMVALLPLGLFGVAAGVSLGSLVAALYGLRKVAAVVGVAPAEIGAELWPPALAALAMAAVLVPLEFLVLEAAAHDTVPALALLALEAAIGAAVYAGVLRLVLPDALGELRALLSAARRGRRGTAGPAAPDEGRGH